jgi:phosphoribosylglycinamide formyltransferase-1
MSGDTPETLSARVQRVEHIIYPKVIGLIAAGRIRVADDQVYLDDRRLSEPLVDSSGVLSP